MEKKNEDKKNIEKKTKVQNIRTTNKKWTCAAHIVCRTDKKQTIRMSGSGSLEVVRVISAE